MLRGALPASVLGPVGPKLDHDAAESWARPSQKNPADDIVAPVHVATLTKSSPAREPVPVNVGRLSRRLLLACIGAVVFLWMSDYFVNYSEWTSIGAIRRMCSMTREDALASWFQVTQTLLTGLTALLIWSSMRHTAADTWHVRSWLVVALFFLYLSVDDGSQVHERIGTAFDTLRERGVGPGVYFPSYAWQIIFVPLLGTVGLDFQEGLEAEHRLNVYTAIVRRWDFTEFAGRQFGETPFDTVTHFSQSLEEGLEMVSISIFWALFVAHLAREPRFLSYRFTDPAGADGRRAAG